MTLDSTAPPPEGERYPPSPRLCESINPAVACPRVKSAPSIADVTSPSSVSSPSRPSKRDTAPRPHSAPKPVSVLPPVSANDEPVSSSRPLTSRVSKRLPCVSSSSLRSHFENASSRASASRRSASSSVAPPPSRCPATLASTPGARGASSRLSTASSTWLATVRPNRASHALGIASVLSMVPVASPSSIVAPDGLESVNVIVSPPSSWASSSTGTETVLPVSPDAKVSVPEAAV